MPRNQPEVLKLDIGVEIVMKKSGILSNVVLKNQVSDQRMTVHVGLPRTKMQNSGSISDLLEASHL